MPSPNLPVLRFLASLMIRHPEARSVAEGLPLPVAGALQSTHEAAVAQIGGYLSLAASEAQMAQLPKGSTFGADQQKCLVDLFLLARHAPESRPLVLDVFRTVPFAPFLFRGIRRVFKAAEAVDDAETFGLLARRFDEVRATYDARWGYVYVPALKRGVRTEDALGNEDSRLAWSAATRGYFRRRVSGDNCDALARLEIPPMSNSPQPACSKRTKTKSPAHAADITGSHAGRRRNALPLSLRTLCACTTSCTATGHRLETSSDALNWRYCGHRIEATAREEAYPRLWDAAPDTLLKLLTESTVEDVRAFAGRALMDNSAFCLDLPAYVIADLLTGDSDSAYEFGLEVARMQLARRGDAFHRLIPSPLRNGPQRRHRTGPNRPDPEACIGGGRRTDGR